MENIEKTTATYKGKKLSLVKCTNSTCDGCFFDEHKILCSEVEEVEEINCQGFIFVEQKQEDKVLLISLETYIDILFMYNKEFYVERIFTSDIENHCDSIWNYWFKNLEEDRDPNLTFEIVADRDSYGNLTTENIHILVYEDQDCDDPKETIHEVSFRKSWCNHKAFR